MLFWSIESVNIQAVLGYFGLGHAALEKHIPKGFFRHRILRELEREAHDSQGLSLVSISAVDVMHSPQERLHELQ